MEASSYLSKDKHRSFLVCFAERAVCLSSLYPLATSLGEFAAPLLAEEDEFTDRSPLRFSTEELILSNQCERILDIYMHLLSGIYPSTIDSCEQ